MSSHAKDPLEKQDSPSESSESHSNSDVDEAEENLEHLKIDEQQTKKVSKDDPEKSKPLESLKSKGDLLNEPTAGPSGLQEPYLASSDRRYDPESKLVILSEPQKGKETKVVVESIEDKEVEDPDENLDPESKATGLFGSQKEMEEKGAGESVDVKIIIGESDTTSSTPPFIQSSTGLTPMEIPLPETKIQDPGPSGIRREVDFSKLPRKDVFCHFFRPGSKNASSRFRDFASSSANTSADVSEIRSEVADISTDASAYMEAKDKFEKDQSTNTYASAVERQSSEASESNISEIPDEYIPPPTPPNTSISSSTPSEEQGNRAYLAQIQREAERCGTPISTSSGIGSTNQSELVNLQRWGLVGEMGSRRRNVDNRDSPDRDISENFAQAEELQPISESMEEPVMGQEMLEFDRLFQQNQQNEENLEASNMPEGSESAQAAPVEIKAGFSCVGAGSPDVRRRLSSDSSSSGRGAVGKSRLGTKPVTRSKTKMVLKKLSVHLQSSSESTEPKSSSSDGLNRTESPEILSLSEAKELPQSRKGKKSWQKSGQLRSMQQQTMSSKDSIISIEEEEQTSLSETNCPELMESKDVSPEKMETTPEKFCEGSAANAELSELEPSGQGSSYGACASAPEKTSKEPEQSVEDLETERSVGKSKRHLKLSTSPSSDEMQSSKTDLKSISRPKKKSRPDKIAKKPRRTRHDSGGSVAKSVNFDQLKEEDSESTSVPSDFSLSDEEKESSQ